MQDKKRLLPLQVKEKVHFGQNLQSFSLQLTAKTPRNVEIIAFLKAER